jgi:membrane associated rhomboid family serine protease
MDWLAALTGGAPVAGVLLAVMIGASALGLIAAPGLIERSLFRPHWLVPKGEYATLLSSGFMHADVMHLLFNAFTFWAFAFGLERAIGSERFFWLYACGLLASDLGTWLRHRHQPEYRTLGASGAITAVLFASIVYFPNGSIYILPIPVPIPSPLFALAYLAYTWFASRRPDGRINHDAHLSGALAGIAFVALTDGAAIGRVWQQVAGG